MENKRCYLCGNEDLEMIHKGTRDRADINVLKCKKCGLVFLSTFDHIHNGFYEKSKMRENIIDNEVWKKSTSKDNQRRVKDLSDIISGKDVLDFGCGKGGFLDCAKGIVKNIYGIELDAIVREELKSLKGYCLWENLEHCNQQFDVITLFHVIEHLENPIEIYSECKKHLKPGGKIIIETPNADDALLTLFHSEKFADFSYWSPHIYLYTIENLKTLAGKADFNISWYKQIQRYPLANHLYWLADQKPGGHIIYDFFNSNILNEQYEKVLMEKDMCDTLMICLESKE